MTIDFNSLAEEHLKDIRQLDYQSLTGLVQTGPLTKELVAEDGQEYTSQIRCIYENGKKQTIRINLSIFKPHEIKPWWQFWKNIDTAIYNKTYIVGTDNTWQPMH